MKRLTIDYYLFTLNHNYVSDLKAFGDLCKFRIHCPCFNSRESSLMLRIDGETRVGFIFSGLIKQRQDRRLYNIRNRIQHSRPPSVHPLEQ